EGLGTKVFEGVPLCGYFLALGYAVFGSGGVPIARVQAAFGALGIALLYLFCRRAFSKSIALLSAAFAILYAPFVLYESFRLADGLATFFASAVLLAALGFLRRPTARRRLRTRLLRRL